MSGRTQLTLSAIQSGLRGREPLVLPTDGGGRAAVAAILQEVPRPGAAGVRADAGDPGDAGARPLRMLFIERATRADDPWSGRIAFPGGMAEPGDAGIRATAERETREEVGLDLTPAEILSRLDDVEGAAPGYERLVVSAFVYHVDQPPALTLNHEVRDALWVPVHGLLDAAHHVPYYWPREQRESHYPGIVVGHPERQVVWGLTYRFLELFFDALGLPLRR